MVEELLIDMSFFSEIYDSPVGPLQLITDKNYLYFLKFYSSENHINSIFFDKKIQEKPNQIINDTIIQLTEYFSGKRKIFDISIKFLYGTKFQMNVWEKLRSIKYGETASYMDVAKLINNPRSYRAVGNANNKNPISIIIPCHSIIANDGNLGGYGAGLKSKSFLLNLESTN